MIIHYKGAGLALQDVLGAHADIALSAIPPTVAHIKAGRLNALAVTSRAREPALPEVPTAAEAGFADYEVDNILRVAGTPAKVITVLQAELSRVLQLPEVKDRLVANAFQPVGSTPQALESRLRGEHAKGARFVQESGLTAD